MSDETERRSLGIWEQRALAGALVVGLVFNAGTNMASGDGGADAITAATAAATTNATVIERLTFIQADLGTLKDQNEKRAQIDSLYIQRLTQVETLMGEMEKRVDKIESKP